VTQVTLFSLTARPPQKGVTFRMALKTWLKHLERLDSIFAREQRYVVT